MCGACHSFLFASTGVEEGQGLTRIPESSDDEDSGNDEPPYNAAGGPSNANVQVSRDLQVGQGVPHQENMEDVDEEEDDEVPEDIIEANVREGGEEEEGAMRAVDELPLVRPRPNPPRNVLQYLDLLSVPRQNDRIDDPRIEALATEGEWWE